MNWKTLFMFALAGGIAIDSAFAHAQIDHADPRVGSKVKTQPREVRIWFTEKLEPAFSKVTVLDANGKQIDKGDSHVDSKDPTLLIVSLPQLSNGTYKVK